MMFTCHMLTCGAEKIATRHYCGGGESIFLLHGAGNASQARLHKVAEFLQGNQFNVVSLDYSGHGESSRNAPSSINIKTEQAHAVIRHYAHQNQPIHLFAWSMSGQIAVNLLAHVPNIASLTLFAPALYAEDILPIEFGCHFTRAIREHGNWSRSNAVRILPIFQAA